MWTLWNKIYLIKTVFENFIKWGLKGGILIDADSAPLGYVLWCCGSRSWEVFTFFQIGSGHTVPSSPNTKVVRKEQANKNLVAAQSLFWDHLYIAYFHVKSVHLTRKELILPLWPQKVKNYWEVYLASGTSAASMISTTSVASMTSTASFHQKTYWAWCFH